MNTVALRQVVMADANRIVHITLPANMPDCVEVIVLAAEQVMPRPTVSKNLNIEAQAIDDTGFVRDVIASPAEECWNAL